MTRFRHRTVALLALMLVTLGSLTACEETTTTDRNTALRLLNADRVANGRPRVKLDATLNAKADAWAQHLRDTCTLSHSKLTDGLGALNWRQVAENVGYAGSIDAVERAFMRSTSHRATILKANLEIVGLGVVKGTCNGNTRVYVVQVFVDLF